MKNKSTYPEVLLNPLNTDENQSLVDELRERVSELENEIDNNACDSDLEDEIDRLKFKISRKNIQLAQKDKIIEKLKELYAYESINEKDDLEDFEVETVVHLSAINRKNSQTIISKSISSKNGKLARKIKKEVEELENASN